MLHHLSHQYSCGQREGLLAEAHSEEVDQADPFYAHCKLHTDKNLLKKRRRNWLAVQTKIAEARKHAKKETDEFLRIQRRLNKSRNKYSNGKMGKVQPWVPTQKMGRLVTTSASACRALWRKAELSGVDTTGWTIRQAGADSLVDIHKRWHIQPAFNVEFIGYYLDRNVRIISMRKQLKEYTAENTRLLDQQSLIEAKRDEVVKKHKEEAERNGSLKALLGLYQDLVRKLCPAKSLPSLDAICRPTLHPPVFPSGVPTAAARKAVFSGALAPSDTDLSDHSTGGERVSLNKMCGLCRGRHDQHLLAKCDTCYRHYHLACLNPPLTRMPKKTKLMGWQCSECDKDSSSSDVEVDAEAPRKLRNKDNGDSLDGSFPADSSAADVDTSSGNIARRAHWMKRSVPPEGGVGGVTGGDLSIRGGKKRKREKHHRYSPDPDSVRDRSHRHKHKRSKQQAEQRQSLKICFKSIPHPGGSGSSYVATPSSSLSPHPLPSSLATPPTVAAAASARVTPKKKEEPQPIVCFTCTLPGEANNTVRCDECLHDFHFSCLDPPVKKSPKVRGYSWHCANCDPTESE